jgi:hypothetical protein
MILDPVLFTEMLIDAPIADDVATAIKEISLTGELVTPTHIGFGEITRYVLFVGRLRPFIFRHSGVQEETEKMIENLSRTLMSAANSSDFSPKVTMDAYRLSFSSNLNYSIAHLAAAIHHSKETALCSRATILALSQNPNIKLALKKEYAAGEFAIIALNIV